MTNWYDTGFEHADEIQKRAEAARNKDFGPRRFWIPNDGGKTVKNIIVIGGVLDSDNEITSNPFCIYEHNLKMNGKWGNYFTCLSKRGQPCAVCEKTGDRPSYVGFFTIIDRTQWEDKQGNTRINEKLLLPAKSSTLRLLKTLTTQLPGNTLVGQKFAISRTGDKSPAVGDMWIPQGPISEEELAKLTDSEGKACNFDPLDYAKWLAPLSHEDQTARLSRGDSGSTGSSTPTFVPPTSGSAAFESSY